MITRTDLLSYLDTLLSPKQFEDYCPNGLQVAGRMEINTLVTGVTASQALLDAAIDVGADAILVHHGYFWKGENPCVVGLKQQRLKALLLNEVNLLAYHLPLDAHAELGNNIQLARVLGFEVTGTIEDTGLPELALQGRLPIAQSADVLAAHLATQLDHVPLVIAGHARSIETVGWCTGAAQGYIAQAAAAGLDAFISGEASEQTTHLARELGITYFAAGHHATERYGVQAFGAHLAVQFGIEHHFIDIDNPV